MEKRWTTLRDTFSREHRKRTEYVPSGSARIPVREWELYQSMVFLVPHTTHRRTKSTYRVPLQQTVDECASQHNDVPRRIDSPSTSSIAADNSNDPDDFIDPGKNFVPNFVNT